MRNPIPDYGNALLKSLKQSPQIQLKMGPQFCLIVFLLYSLMRRGIVKQITSPRKIDGGGLDVIVCFSLRSRDHCGWMIR